MKFPQKHVIGGGCDLDTAPFPFLIGQKLGIAVWKLLWVGPCKARRLSCSCVEDLNSDIETDKDPQQWESVHKDVIASTYEIIKMKSYTSWVMGLSLADSIESFL